MRSRDVAREGTHGTGPGRPSARQIGRSMPPLAVLLLLASLATAGVGLWLCSIIALVLPARDPAHIPMWRAIAVSFIAYSALTWGCLATGARRGLLRGSLLVASVAALGLGLYGVVDMVRRASRGGDFEGYIVLMGLILSGHGLVAATYSLVAGAKARPAAATSADPPTTPG